MELGHCRALLALSCLAAIAQPSSAEEPDRRQIRHALLLSVDGLHALDVARYVADHPGSALAELAGHGVTYSNARTPANSDSFPGLLALVTGGSPISHGLFYDVSYDRTIFDPTNTSCSGQPGNTMVFDETIDLYDAAHVSRDVIDPATLPRHLDAQGHCLPLYPHQALRTNTIFEVAKSAGLHTAWADKHPAYDLVNGPSGTGVDDLYTPEITNVGGFDATGSVVCTARNDEKRVQAVLNEIQGLRHDGAPGAGVPAIFGMNFQAVSVGQKLARDNKDGSCSGDPLTGQKGGYLDGSGTPTQVLAHGLQKTDEAIGRMVAALRQQGVYHSTLVIVPPSTASRRSTRRWSTSPGTSPTWWPRCRTPEATRGGSRSPTRTPAAPAPAAWSRTTTSRSSGCSPRATPGRSRTTSTRTRSSSSSKR